MAFPGITSDTTHHAAGSATGTFRTGAGVVAAIICTVNEPAAGDCVVLHDSSDPVGSPNPLITIYMHSGNPVVLCWPYAQAPYFATALSYAIVGDCAIHVTTHAGATP
jgi:hypothetical protein